MNTNTTREDWKKRHPAQPKQTQPLTAEQLARLADNGPELLVLFKSLTFTAETVAHLRGLERELLPCTDRARELIARIEG